MTKQKKIILAGILNCAIFFMCTQLIQASQTIHFNVSIADDATPAVLEKMLKAKTQSVSKITFEKGTYHFYPDKGLEHFCYISNHEDVLARTAFPLFDFNDITIDGQGSSFIFHGRMIPFIIEGGSNITIKNLSVDWAVPFHSEGLVIANNPKNMTLDLKYQAHDSYEIRNGELIFVKEYYEHNIGQNIVFDPERRAIAYLANNYGIASSTSVKTQFNVNKISYKYKGDHYTMGQIGQGRESTMNATEISPGTVRLTTRKKPAPIGTVIVGKGDKGLNRVAPAFRVTGTNDFKAQNVTVHHANGMGFICENSENVTLDAFNVTPSGNRVLSTTADATHFVGCRGNILLNNCLLECQMDDAMNVHGTYQEVMDVLGEKTIGIRGGHFEQQNFIIGRTGDKIGVVRLADSFEPYHHLTIKSIQVINGRYQKIRFNEKLPSKIQAGDLIENLDAYPEVTVQNCTIRGNRARGLLISTPRKTIIKNNFFHTQMEAILVPVESSSWFESGSAANLFIQNNTFQDCNHGGHERGTIRFHTDDDNENIAFNNIEISNNKFNLFDNLVLEVSNTDGLIFKNNLITNTGTFPPLYPESPAFKVKTSKNVEFVDNNYKGKAPRMFESDNKLTLK